MSYAVCQIDIQEVCLTKNFGLRNYLDEAYGCVWTS